MRFILVIGCLMAVSAQVSAQPMPGCAAGSSIVRRSELPAQVVAAIPFVFADPGQRFQKTDVVETPGLPGHRLICAEQRGDNYLVHFERGGIAYGYQSLLIRRDGAGYVSAPAN